MIADFRDVLAAFVAHDVRFLVVGAHALAAHGVPRVTGDLDIWIAPNESNASRVWDALAEFGAPLVALNVKVSDFSTPGQVVQLGLPPYRIDVMTSISGVEFDEAEQGSLAGMLFGAPVRFIGREALVRNKRASGRPKDLADVRSLGE
ncbi:MAG: hypothetical protein HUU26_00705 [Gemmatimonadaceae bacterium]|nr:hypothetical protein [Gemmatimonadaceae bacterium]